MVEVEKWPVKEASQVLKINRSTAKSMIRLFRMTGRIEIKDRVAYADGKILKIDK
jgi:DNA-directed RNA polymerase specialized sigma24 family protein